MSPSKSKSKDKRGAAKEAPKSATKPTTTTNTASGYDPLLGTFHNLESAPVSSVAPVHANGRFRDIDDTEDPSGNSGTGGDYDCVSNNGSWSGESEDPKDKPSQWAGPGPTVALGVDSEKREKIRQKNEKKHQRQKERRAQELHERCCGYLMSRKLEALAQQLVAMGFPLERATMALILNEGKVEESVAWLFEGGEDGGGNQRERNVESGGGNLKVDISQELAQIVEMEVKYKCSKQEVERAVVACEGDLQQAAENLLKLQKQESHGGGGAPAKPDGDSTSGSVNGKATQIASAVKVQAKRTLSNGAIPIPIQQKAEEKDINYTNVAGTGGGTKNIQLLKKVAAPSGGVEKRWPVSATYSMASPLPPPKTETQYPSIGSEFKNLQLGSIREPVVMIQRPKANLPVTSMSSSSPSVSHVTDWNTNGVVEPLMNMSNGFSHMPPGTRSFNSSSYGSNQMYDQFHYQPRQQQPQYVSSSGLLDHQAVGPNHLNNNNGMWNRMVGPTTPTLAPASSLGLFTGSRSNGGSGSGSGSGNVDWNGEWNSQFDYTSIDWSLNRVPTAGSALRPNGMWMGSGSSSVGGELSVSGRSGKAAVRTTALSANGNSGMSIGVGSGVVGGSETSGGGSREWTSPFEEKDLFTLPRKFVSSPSFT